MNRGPHPYQHEDRPPRLRPSCVLYFDVTELLAAIRRVSKTGDGLIELANDALAALADKENEEAEEWCQLVEAEEWRQVVESVCTRTLAIADLMEAVGG